MKNLNATEKDGGKRRRKRSPGAKDKLKERSDVLSKEVVLFCRKGKQRGIEGPILNQILRSGTSVRANVNEAHGAHGNKDFSAKLHVALKECKECDGWFKLLLDTETITLDEFKFFHNKCVEICILLRKSIDTAEGDKET